jgi:hypothetical protein
MQLRTRYLTVVLCLVLCNCSVVDPFGPRADTYNNTERDSRARLLLSNIVRSSYEEPLQWSTVSQVSGTASAGGTLGGKIPIIGHLPSGGSLLYEIDPSVTASGGPTFTVPMLDTKEFQSGIQTPLSPQLLKTFMDEGYPLDFLLPLIVSQITIGSAKDKTFQIKSFDVDDPTKNLRDPLAANRTLIGALHMLVLQGLTIDKYAEAVGPVIPVKNVKALKDITDALSGGVDIQQYDVTKTDDALLTSADRKVLAEAKSTVYLRALHRSTYRFCFDPTVPALTLHQDLATVQKRAGLVDNLRRIPPPSFVDKTIYLLIAPDGKQLDPESAVLIRPQFFCGYKGQPEKGDSTLVLTPRSVEGTVRFLGALTRTQLGLGLSSPQKPLTLSFNLEGKDPGVLFQVQHGALGGASVSVQRADGVYSVSLDNYPLDMSGKVLTFLLEAINLNNSAKDLPTPSVISVISP